jgi:5-methylcytosine-specific restriction endonuclease McrA
MSNKMKKKKKLTEEHKKKISLALMGHRPWKKGMSPSLETRKKISEGLRGRGFGGAKKGHPTSLETRRKISEANKGGHWTLSLETRKKMSEVCRGEKCYRWKGGITPENRMERHKFRQEIQKIVLERDNYTCQLCSKRGVALQVDHIQSWAEYPDLRFNVNNCRTLCDKCHYFVTFHKAMPDKVIRWGQNLKHFVET